MTGKPIGAIALLRARCRRAWYCATNALRDVWDRWARGYCCAAPGDIEGAFRFWRCNLRRGHTGLHRTVNYRWGHGEGTLYDPVEHPGPRLDRHWSGPPSHGRLWHWWHRPRPWLG
jgi:hypothetical protein